MKRRRRILLFLLLPAWLIGVGFFQAFKPLPSELAYQGERRNISPGGITFLSDLSWLDREGRQVHEQEIFDTIFERIDGAERCILLDMFLFNSFRGKGEKPLKELAAELAARLVEKKKRSPGIRIDVITDPINIVYGGSPGREIEALRSAGINVIVTDLKELRDSNPGYSAFWRTFIRWFGNSADGGWLPHPFSAGEERVTARSYLTMANFKANHRKVITADYRGGMRTIVSSANPHAGSSAHSNVAVEIAGDLGLDVFDAEIAVALLSKGESPEKPLSAASSSGPGAAEAVLLTESRIRDAAISLLDNAGEGDRISLAMFYLSHRGVIRSLLDASRRGAELRLVLDPNKDAFGYKKNGIPNRPVAAELRKRSAGKVKIRWYDTHGEQFHAKMLFVEKAGGAAELLLGSANFTRRNLDDLNLEMNVLVTAPGSSPFIAVIRDYFEAIWANDGDNHYTVAYEKYGDDSSFRYVLYRLQEFTGLCSF